MSEFIPYVFQVLALMLEMHAVGAVSPPYLALFPHLLLPVLWSRDGNIPPLVRLLQAYISRGIRQIESDKLASVYRYCFSLLLYISLTSLPFVLLSYSLFHCLVRTLPHACRDLPNTAIMYSSTDICDIELKLYLLCFSSLEFSAFFRSC